VAADGATVATTRVIAFGIHPALAGVYAADALEQLIGRRFLQHESRGALLQRLGHFLVRDGGGQHDRFRLDLFGRERVEHGEAAAVGHAEIEQQDVGMRRRAAATAAGRWTHTPRLRCRAAGQTDVRVPAARSDGRPPARLG
jgi:hypothetical protein